MIRANPPRGEDSPASRMAELFPGSLESVIALALSAAAIKPGTPLPISASMRWYSGPARRSRNSTASSGSRAVRGTT